MATTSYMLPTAVTYNGPGVSGWLEPSNILLVDNKFTTSSGATSIITVGNFNLNLAQGNDITNFTVRIKGYRGSFNTTLNIYAVDNTTGVELSYPMAPFQSFSGTNTLFTLPSTLFGTTWTVDQANNIQLKLIADGELHVDAIEISADYVPQVTPVPVAPSTGQVVVDEFVQSIRFQLASSITDTDLFCFTKSFTLPDGTPIQYPDFHGEALIVIDQGVPFLEENIRITNIEHNYQGTNLTRISFGNITNRGLKFIYPYDHDINLCKPHDGTAEFVISNSAPFYDRFLRKNQINALVSAPIYVQDESVQLADPVHILDFKGPGVSVVNDGIDSFKKVITIPGNGINPPFVYSTSSATSGASQVSSLQWSHTSGGLDRTLIVQVSTETASTVSGITYNGVALTQSVSDTNGSVRSEQWHLVAPPIGTYNIVVTLSAPAFLTCGAETYNTTDQSSPIGVTQTADGSSLTPSLVLATSTNNSIVVDSLATGTLPIVYIAGAAQSENWHITVNPNARQGASSVESAGSAPDAVTMSWAITQSTPWVMTALELKGVSSAITGVQTVTGLDTDNTDPVNPIVQIAVDGSTITGDGTPGNPLVATAGGGGTGTSLETTISQTAHGLSVGDVIKVSGTNTFAKAQADTEVNSETVGIVTTVVNANSFKYISSAIQLAIAPIGTPGSAVWLDPSVAGGMTTTKPSVLGQVARSLGTIIESGVTMYFDIAALAEVIGTGSGSSTNFFSTNTPSYGIVSPDTPSNTAVLELSDGTLFSYTVGVFNNYCITADKTKVYKATITYTLGSNYTISLEEYIGNANGSIGTLSVTYTGTGVHTVATNNFEGGIFVEGTKVFIPLANSSFLTHYTEWTLSGTSLISPLTTNLNYSTLTNFVNFYWFYDGTYYYTYNNAADGLITKWTYSSGTFTVVATAALSSSVDTQTDYGTGVGIDPRMQLLFFRIVTGKIGNFGMLVTTGSTFLIPKFTSGVIYLENSSI